MSAPAGEPFSVVQYQPISNVSSQGSQSLHHNKAYQGSTSSEEYDTDIGGTGSGSNPTSPENDANNNGGNSHENNRLGNKTRFAVPEYFANRITKDGKIPKKRGPKPDSKPARDRRQELNRQAQRNHRQRKEDQQKWLESALADANKKANDARLRSEEAERRHQHVTQIYEQSQRENDRLKQLLDVNGIPFARVIPQPPLGLDRAPVAQQPGTFTNATSTTPIAASTTPISKPSPQSFSYPNDVSNDPTVMSTASPYSMDSSEDYEEHGSSPQLHTFQSSDSNQSTGEMMSTFPALTGQRSGPITDLASTPANMSANYGARFHQPSIPQFTDPTPDTAYPTSIDFSQSSSPPLVDASTRGVNPDPDEIKDHDEAGVKFILALEANCQDHKTMMNALTFHDPEKVGGHSLMLSRVPIDVAKKYHPGDPPHPHGPPDVGEGPGKYARLLSLVNLQPSTTNSEWQLQSGEISPAQALGYIRNDPRYVMFNNKDFAAITKTLKDRCRCYGFGAVVEVYEVEDALNDIFAKKGFGLEDGYGPDHSLWRQYPLSNPHTLDGPEYPSLDRLIDFNVAELMKQQHASREQFLAADLQAYGADVEQEEGDVAYPNNFQGQEWTSYQG